MLGDPFFYQGSGPLPLRHSDSNPNNRYSHSDLMMTPDLGGHGHHQGPSAYDMRNGSVDASLRDSFFDESNLDKLEVLLSKGTSKTAVARSSSPMPLPLASTSKCMGAGESAVAAAVAPAARYRDPSILSPLSMYMSEPGSGPVIVSAGYPDYSAQRQGQGQSFFEPRNVSAVPAAADGPAQKYIGQLETELGSLEEQHAQAVTLLCGVTLDRDTARFCIAESQARRVWEGDESEARQALLLMHTQTALWRLGRVWRDRCQDAEHRAMLAEQQHKASTDALNVAQSQLALAHQHSEQQHQQHAKLISAAAAAAAPVVQPVAVPAVGGTDAALASTEAIAQLTNAVSSLLKQENAHLAQLVEAVPSKVCSAIVPEASPGAFSPGRISPQPVVPLLSTTSGVSTGDLRNIEDQLQAVLRELKEGRGTASAHRAFSQKKPGSPGSITSPSSTFAAAAAAENSRELSWLFTRVLAAYESTEGEYLHACVKKEAYMEYESEVVRLIHSKHLALSWSTQSNFKKAELQRLNEVVLSLRAQLAAHQQQQQHRVSMSPSCSLGSTSQVYEHFVLPYIPGNLRETVAPAKRSISQLREEALQVGARPADAWSEGDAPSAAAAAAIVTGSSIVESSNKDSSHASTAISVTNIVSAGNNHMKNTSVTSHPPMPASRTPSLFSNRPSFVKSPYTSALTPDPAAVNSSQRTPTSSVASASENARGGVEPPTPLGNTRKPSTVEEKKKKEPRASGGAQSAATTTDSSPRFQVRAFAVNDKTSSSSSLRSSDDESDSNDARSAGAGMGKQGVKQHEATALGLEEQQPAKVKTPLSTPKPHVEVKPAELEAKRNVFDESSDSGEDEPTGRMGVATKIVPTTTAKTTSVVVTERKPVRTFIKARSAYSEDTSDVSLTSSASFSSDDNDIRRKQAHKRKDSPPAHDKKKPSTAAATTMTVGKVAQKNLQRRSSFDDDDDEEGVSSKMATNAKPVKQAPVKIITSVNTIVPVPAKAADNTVSKGLKLPSW